jgi:hypothetical protein
LGILGAIFERCGTQFRFIFASQYLAYVTDDLHRIGRKRAASGDKMHQVGAVSALGGVGDAALDELGYIPGGVSYIAFYAINCMNLHFRSCAGNG